MTRYAAKLVFIWDPDPVTESTRRRLCEERIVVFRARSAREAIRKAKVIGRSEELRYESGHRLRFAGVLQCMDLALQDEIEVWWEYRRRSDPEKWARKAIPPSSDLYVFTDRSSAARQPADKRMQRTVPRQSERRR